MGDWARERWCSSVLQNCLQPLLSLADSQRLRNTCGIMPNLAVTSRRSTSISTLTSWRVTSGLLLRSEFVTSALAAWHKPFGGFQVVSHQVFAFRYGGRVVLPDLRFA